MSRIKTAPAARPPTPEQLQRAGLAAVPPGHTVPAVIPPTAAITARQAATPQPTPEQIQRARRDYLAELAPLTRIMADAITLGKPPRFILHQSGAWESDPVWTSEEWQAIYEQASALVQAIRARYEQLLG